MNRIEFNKIVDNRIELIKSLLKKKGAEYSGDEEVFHNFIEGAKISFADKREMVAWEYMSKHLVSIKDMLSSDDAYSESMIKEKFGDAINYLILLEAMMLESNGINYRFCEAVKKTAEKADKLLEEKRIPQAERGIDQMGLPKLPSNSTSPMTIDKLKMQQLPPNYDEWYYSNY